MATCEVPGVAFGLTQYLGGSGPSSMSEWGLGAGDEDDVLSSKGFVPSSLTSTSTRSNCNSSSHGASTNGSRSRDMAPSPTSFCPILPADWKSPSPVPNDPWSLARATGAPGKPTPCLPNDLLGSPQYSDLKPPLGPHREHLMRSSTEYSWKDIMLSSAPAVPPAVRRKSMSSEPELSAQEQLLRQHLSMQMQLQEEQWRRAHQQGNAMQAGTGGASPSDSEFPQWTGHQEEPLSTCLNEREVEDLCSNMDLAGMRVDQVEICCPPPHLTFGMAPDGVECVLMALKFESMTILHYPGDNRAKDLFSAMCFV